MKLQFLTIQQVLHDDDNWTDIGVRITGDQKQIQIAEQMIKDLHNQAPSQHLPTQAESNRQTNPSSGASADDWGAIPTGNVVKSSWEPSRRTEPDRWQKPAFEATKRQGNSFDSREKRQTQSFGDALIIKVPSAVVGRIIGRGGSKINELQEQSGARIKVE